MDHLRHSAIFNASHLTVALIGAGGIGSLTGIVLAKMGVAAISAYDYDQVSSENVPTQFYALSDVGKDKAVVLAGMMAALGDPSETEFRAYKHPITSDCKVMATVVISAVDSIRSRQAIFQAISCRWYLDARMASEEFHLYALPMFECEAAARYRAELFALRDGDIPDEPCTSKATIYTAAIAAGHLGAAVKQIAVGERPPHYLYHNIRTGTLVQGNIYGSHD